MNRFATLRRIIEAAVISIPFSQTFTLKLGVRLVPAELLFLLVFLLVVFSAGSHAYRKQSLIMALLFGTGVLSGALLGVLNYVEIMKGMPVVALRQMQDYLFWIILDASKGFAIVGLILGLDVYIRGAEDFRRLSRIVAASALFVAGYGIYVYFARGQGLPLLPGTYTGRTMRSASTFWEPNTFGNFTILALAFYVIHCLSVEKRRPNPIALMVLMAGGLVSYSTVFLGLFLPVLLLYSLMYKEKRAILVGLAIALLGAAYMAAHPEVFLDIVRERLLAKVGLAEGAYVHISTQERVAVLNGALALLRDSGWLGGLGLGSSFAFFGKVSNVAVELWLDCSLVGLAAFLGVLAIPFAGRGQYHLAQRLIFAALLVLISASLGFKFSPYFYFFAVWSFHLGQVWLGEGTAPPRKGAVPGSPPPGIPHSIPDGRQGSLCPAG